MQGRDIDQPTAGVQKNFMKCEIFIVTFPRDYTYLHYCLKSIQKFATGFSGVTILVPKYGGHMLLSATKEFTVGSIPIRCREGDEWADRGFLWHMAQVMRSDEWCPDADYIAHIDPDCVFTGPVTPETFFRDGKPILRYEHFDTLSARHPGNLVWKTACERALPFGVDREFMRGHPEVYARENYAIARELIELKTGIPVDDYIKSCRNEFPQSFAEFPTLGAVAFHISKDKYALHDCALQSNPDMQDYPIFQAWSHNPPDVTTTVWYQGRQQSIKPVDIYKKIGL